MKYALVLILTLLSFTAARADKIAIAVLDLDAKGEGMSQGVADALTENVRFEFSKQESLDLVARDKMIELAKEKAIQLSGCTDVSCAVKIGKAINAQKIVVGSVVKLGDKGVLYLRTVDVEREKVECSEKYETGSEAQNLDNAVPIIVMRISGCILEQRAREILIKNPKDARAYYNLGHALSSRFEKTSEAEVYFRKAIELNPKFTDAYCTLGVTLEAQGKYEEAEQVYRKVVRLEPNDGFSHYFLGGALQQQAKLKEAETEYREATRLIPNNPHAHYDLGIVLWDQGNLEEAEKELRKAVWLKEDFPIALVNLGVLLDAKNKRKEAREFWERALKYEASPERIDQINKRLAEPD
jgi:Flp pilus assembly protein TadD/TolB-like protein